jgi:metal-responsive CopG/Arc/MetJ family transcriptional regulator
MAESKAISIRVPDLLLEKIDRLAEEKYKSHKGTPNRSLVVLDAIVAYFDTLSDTSKIEDIATVSDSVSIVEFNELRDITITLSHTVKQLEDRLFTQSDNVIELDKSTKSKLENEELEQGHLDAFTLSGSVILNGKQLAERLGVTSSTITNHKNSSELLKWSREKDPESIGWSYDLATNKFLSAKPLA